MSEVVWSLPRRVAFRFGILAGILLVLPFPLYLIPKLEWLGDVVMAPWRWAVPWFAENVLGIERPVYQMTGSGDTLWQWVFTLLVVIVAAIGAAVWSIVDRRRLAYPRVQAAAIVVLRYYLASTLLSYGLAKVFSTQFPPPALPKYDQSVGELSPMGLLWTFMGHSQPYTIACGLAESIAGLLLLFRRTSVIGALVGAGVMANVVLLNFCYDVPVKLYSSLLLVGLVLLLVPHARRVAAALLGRAVPEVPPRTRGSPRVERARFIAKLGALALLAYGGYQAFDFWRDYPPPPNALHGTWVVETFASDGVERAPLVTDEVRWRKLIVGEYYTQIRRMTDKRRNYRDVKIDPVARTVALGDNPAMRYTLTDADHLVLDGDFEGKRVHVTFVRAPEPLLTSRGFHWVQEYPFNR